MQDFRRRRQSAWTCRHAGTESDATQSNAWNQDLPIRRPVVLEELSPYVLAGIEAVDDRIDDACCAVDDVQWRMEALLYDLARRYFRGILIGDPAGIDRIHMD